MKNHGTVRPATLGQIKDLISALAQAIPVDRLSFDQAKYWIGNKGEFARKLEFLRKSLVRVVCDGFHVIVDYTKSLSEMIQSGNYDWVNNGITWSRYPIQGQGRVEYDIELVHYEPMDLDDIVQDMEGHGLRPITLGQLLTFGSAYPNEQRKFSIIALGALCRYPNGDRYIVYLDSDGSKRGLSSGAWDDNLCKDGLFAVIRKTAQ